MAALRRNAGHSRRASGPATIAPNTPTATNTAPVYAWTAHHATAATRARSTAERWGHSSSTSAVAVLASAEPIVGFHTSADRHRSYAAVARNTTVVSASHTELVRRHTAAKSSVSAADCSIAWPMPPACGRLWNHGPTVTRIIQRIK